MLSLSSLLLHGRHANPLRVMRLSLRQALLASVSATLLLSTPAHALSMADISVRPYFDAGNEMTAFDEWHVASGVSFSITPEWQWFIANQVGTSQTAAQAYNGGDTGAANSNGVVSGVSYQWSQNLRLESRIGRENRPNAQQSSIAFGSALSLTRSLAVKAGMNVQTTTLPSNPQTDVQLGLGLGVTF